MHKLTWYFIGVKMQYYMISGLILMTNKKIYLPVYTNSIIW